MFNFCVIALVSVIIGVNSAPQLGTQQQQQQHQQSFTSRPTTHYEEQTVPVILKYSYEPNSNNDGGYKFEYETSDGQYRREEAFLKYVGEENTPILAVSGAYSYVGSDGVQYVVNYLSDENGFQPVGNHLPSSPSSSVTQQQQHGQQQQFQPTQPQYSNVNTNSNYQVLNG